MNTTYRLPRHAREPQTRFHRFTHTIPAYACVHARIAIHNIHLFERASRPPTTISALPRAHQRSHMQTRTDAQVHGSHTQPNSAGMALTRTK